ncbi:MAG TPA: uroporphyrinogen-III synthase, partial [Balneolaceae bacterium]|nr:uroporphyrinogen-III synthase [Balneolaceae bacterium]
LGLEPTIKPALEFEFPAYWDEVLKVINDHPKSDWVFTSANGVKGLEALMESGLQVRPETQLFAVGAKTQEALKGLGLESKIPRNYDGKHLAKLILDEGKVDSVIYFHGNLSRDEMTNKLVEKDIEVIEAEVYKTLIRPVKMPDRTFSAILFYSPSAVEGFKQGTGFEQELPTLFAIGETTADALRAETDQEIYVADEADTEVLLQAVANYLFKEESLPFSEGIPMGEGD